MRLLTVAILLAITTSVWGAVKPAARPLAKPAAVKPVEMTKGPRMTTRNFKDFPLVDGVIPSGPYAESARLKAALTAGPGIVNLDAGEYHFADVTIPAGVTLVGAGKATVIKLSRMTGVKRVFVQEGVNDWRLRDVMLDGETPMVDPSARVDSGENGIVISRCSGFEVSGVTVNNFAGIGIMVSYTAGTAYGNWATSATIFNVSTEGNYVGFKFDTRSEYMNVSMLTSQGNYYGCIIHGGNVKIGTSQFVHNYTGMLIEDHENGSHGAISNCLINHNIRYSIQAINVANGMLINNCCFFYGDLDVKDSKGVSVTDSTIGCNVYFSGESANLFADNFIISGTHTFAPSTIVKGNYNEKGPWEPGK